MKSKEELKKYHKDYYLSRKDEDWFKKRKKDYQEKYKARHNLKSAEWKESHAQTHLWSSAKYRAKKVGLEFNIDVTDIVIPEYCPYLGTKLTSDKLIGHQDTHMSVDRIDSSKGYIKGNVEIISYKANLMKQNATKEQLITFAKNILKKHGKE